MSQLLDDLARSLATPMPRRRALRMLGGTLLGIALPAARASAARATHDCPAQNAFLCACPSINGLFYKICCPNETPTEKWECKCKAPPNGGAGCLRVCKEKCGSICCPLGEKCADPDLEYCCPVRQRPCKGGGSVDCCSSTESCCDGTCCPRGTRCNRRQGNKGTCGKCPPKSTKCGNTCCIKGEDCCNGKCCSKSQKCCPSDICCKKSDICCGPTCCTDKQRCCDDHCCTEPKTCCGDGCCNEGSTCYKSGGKFGCCPDERLALTPAGKVCCPRGYYPDKGGCCPTGRACTECEPPCPRGQYCQNGYCLPG